MNAVMKVVTRRFGITKSFVFWARWNGRIEAVATHPPPLSTSHARTIEMDVSSPRRMSKAQTGYLQRSYSMVRSFGGSPRTFSLANSRNTFRDGSKAQSGRTEETGWLPEHL